MHGYHPDEDDTYSAMLSSEPLPKELTSIEQIFWLMVKETGVPVESHPEKALF
jgi:hypothetical protein